MLVAAHAHQLQQCDGRRCDEKNKNKYPILERYLCHGYLPRYLPEINFLHIGYLPSAHHYI